MSEQPQTSSSKQEYFASLCPRHKSWAWPDVGDWENWHVKSIKPGIWCQHRHHFLWRVFKCEEGIARVSGAARKAALSVHFLSVHCIIYFFTFVRFPRWFKFIFPWRITWNYSICRKNAYLTRTENPEECRWNPAFLKFIVPAAIAVLPRGQECKKNYTFSESPRRGKKRQDIKRFETKWHLFYAWSENFAQNE